MPDLGDRGRQSMEGRPSPLTFEESQEGWIAQETIRCIESAQEVDRPFLAFASLPRPHQCTSLSEPFWSWYENEELVLPPNIDYDISLKAPHFRQTVERWRKGDWTLIEPRIFQTGRLRKLHGYLGAVSQVDHAVGQMVGFLERSGLRQNTIVIYTSDHGDYAVEHDIMEKAPGICADAITRIPMIWSWPDHFQSGHASQQLVELVDVSISLCQLADIEPLETSDGKNISHLLQEQEQAVREIAVTEFAWSKSIHKGQYRLVIYPRAMFLETEGFGELYDLDADPWEMNNLYFEPNSIDLVRVMEKDLLEWLVTTTRPATVHGVEIKSSHQTQRRNKYTTNLDGKVHPDQLGHVRTKNYL